MTQFCFCKQKTFKAIVLSNGDVKMLVLSRKKNESIKIADHITITVVEIRGDKVRLGIEAPREVPVHRQEVHEAIQREKAEQAKQDEETKTSSSLTEN